MLANFLLPEMVVRESGVGPRLDIHGIDSLKITLGITRIVPQESLQVSIWGSADGVDWGTEPIAVFTKKFYCGTYPLVIDLSPRLGLRFLRAEWDVVRWGRYDAMPLFDFYLRAERVTVPVTASAVA